MSKGEQIKALILGFMVISVLAFYALPLPFAGIIFFLFLCGSGKKIGEILNSQFLINLFSFDNFDKKKKKK